MTEEKDFWINKDEVGALSNAERTAYKVTQETMNQKGWYKLADDEQIVKRVVLTSEEAEWFEKYKNLPFYSPYKSFSTEIHKTASLWDLGSSEWEKRIDRLTQAYFKGYTVKKEKSYYIRLPFKFEYIGAYKSSGKWYLMEDDESDGYKQKFTQEDLDEMSKDDRFKGLDLNMLKVEVPEDELED